MQDLVAALEDPDTTSHSTSVRQPKALQRALREAVKLGFAPTANEGVNQALRTELEAFAQRRALDAHYAEHPETRPAMTEIAVELARLDHDELADHPLVIAQAAKEILTYRPDADADDVLVWAASLLAHRRELSAD